MSMRTTHTEICSPILVQKQDVEPAVFVLRHVHSYAVAPKFEVHALVLHITNAVQPQTRVTLTQKDRSDGDARVLGFSVIRWQVNLAHVVDEAGDGEHV